MRIALIDSGLPQNTKLNIIKNYKIFTTKDRETKVLESNYHDEHGHATIVMGILEKYCLDAEIINMKILNKDLASNYLSLEKAVEKAVDEGAQIINLSLGTRSEEAEKKIYEKIRIAKEKNITIIAAHNNDNFCIAYPASFEEVIGIKIKNGDLFSNDSDFDYEKNDITMPGTQELTWIDGVSYKMYSTSFLVPHITGIVYSIKTRNEKIDNKVLLKEIEQIYKMELKK